MKKKMNLIHVKYNFVIDNHFPLINNSKSSMEYVFVVSQLKSAVALNFVMMKEIRHWLTLTFVMMKERRYCLALNFVMMKERGQTYIISKTDHLEKIGWGGTLILLHPRTPHKFWRLDSSVQVELQQRHLSGNLNRMKLKQTNKMHQFKVNFLHRQLFLTRISHETLL